MPRIAGSLERLEDRRLVAAIFDLIDLGVSSEPDGQAVLDVGAGEFVLGRTDFWHVVASGKVVRALLSNVGASGRRILRQINRFATGSNAPGGVGPAHASVFRYHTGQRWINTDLATLAA